MLPIKNHPINNDPNSSRSSPIQPKNEVTNLAQSTLSRIDNSKQLFKSSKELDQHEDIPIIVYVAKYIFEKIIGPLFGRGLRTESEWQMRQAKDLLKQDLVEISKNKTLIESLEKEQFVYITKQVLKRDDIQDKLSFFEQLSDLNKVVFADTLFASKDWVQQFYNLFNHEIRGQVKDLITRDFPDAKITFDSEGWIRLENLSIHFNSQIEKKLKSDPQELQKVVEKIRALSKNNDDVLTPMLSLLLLPVIVQSLGVENPDYKKIEDILELAIPKIEATIPASIILTLSFFKTLSTKNIKPKIDALLLRTIQYDRLMTGARFRQFIAKKLPELEKLNKLDSKERNNPERLDQMLVDLNELFVSDYFKHFVKASFSGSISNDSDMKRALSQSIIDKIGASGELNQALEKAIISKINQILADQ